MGRQFRSPRQGEGSVFNSVVSASSKVATVPCTKTVQLLSTTVGADFTLMPPEQGVEANVAVSALVTTGGIILRACTVGATNVSFSSTAGDNVLKFDRVGPHFVSLVGLSTARWLVRSVTIASTAVITGTS